MLSKAESRNRLSVLRWALIMMTWAAVNVQAQQGGTANYLYDANGRLTTVVSPNGEAVIYNYDAAGNFTSVTRRAANELSIIDFTPGTGSSNTVVTISGTGFSTTPSANTVKFNGVTATVTSATKNQLVATVPASATTGPINITNSNGTVTSSGQFYIPNRTPYFSGQMGIGGSLIVPPNPPPTPATSALVTFSGQANQRISLMAENLVFPSGIYGSYYAVITVLTPAGVTLGSVNVEPSPPLPVCADNPTGFGFLEPVTLPATGTYTILVEHYFSLRVGMTLRLYDVPADFTGTIAPNGVHIPFVVGAPGQNATITFNGFTGQQIAFSAQAATSCLSADLKIFSPGTYPNGTPLFSSLLGTRFDVNSTSLPANGIYTIQLNPRYNKTNPVDLVLYSVPADLTDNFTFGDPTRNYTLNSIGQALSLTFTIATGQAVNIGIVPPAATGFTVTLSTQSGTQIFTETSPPTPVYNRSQTLTAGTYVYRISLELPKTGTFSARISPP